MPKPKGAIRQFYSPKTYFDLYFGTTFSILIDRNLNEHTLNKLQFSV